MATHKFPILFTFVKTVAAAATPEILTAATFDGIGPDANGSLPFFWLTIYNPNTTDIYVAAQEVASADMATVGIPVPPGGSFTFPSAPYNYGNAGQIKVKVGTNADKVRVFGGTF